MDTISISSREAYIYAILLSVGFGVLVGLVPLVFGFIRRRRKKAFLGFVLTVVGSAFLGLLLAIPVAAIFTWMIYRSSIEVPVQPTDETPAS